MSLVLKEKGKKVLLASFDDTHNLSDIFKTDFTDKACSMGPGLEVVQVNRDKEINDRKQIISKIKFAGKEFERDKVLARIQQIKVEYQSLKQTFENGKQTHLFAVYNQDQLSVAETSRIIDA